MPTQQTLSFGMGEGPMKHAIVTPHISMPATGQPTTAVGTDKEIDGSRLSAGCVGHPIPTILEEEEDDPSDMQEKSDDGSPRHTPYRCPSPQAPWASRAAKASSLQRPSRSSWPTQGANASSSQRLLAINASRQHMGWR